MDIRLASFVLFTWMAQTAYGQVRYDRSHVSGGSLMAKYVNVTSCLKACENKINCRGIDFDFGDNTCWFHYDKTICNPLKAKENCVHYKIVTCETSRHAIGGTLQKGIIDVTSCINACVEPCKAVDFNTVDSTCWFHEVNTACRQLRRKQNCTHYSRIDCQMLPLDASLSGSPVLESFPGQHALAGDLMTGISSSSMCIQLCHANQLCKAVDFEFSDNSCWFHFEKTACTALMDRPSATHYRLSTCALPVQTEEFPGLHIRGGKHMFGFSDVASCVYACSLEPTCRAVDFDADDNSCWFHDAKTACRLPEPKQSCVHLKLFTCAPNVEPFEVPLPQTNAMPAPFPVPAPPPVPQMPTPSPPLKLEPQPTPVPMVTVLPPVPTGECGTPAISPQTKIVGGREAKAHSWPWQATLLRGTASTGVSLVCGASLISAQYLITAAHCFGNETDPRFWLVTLGDHDLTVVEASQITIEVLSIVIHAQFNPNTLENDIALVKLAQPVEYTVEVSPVCLPEPDLIFPEGLMCMVTGWGDTRGTPTALRTRLNQASVPIFVQASCNRSYSGVITDKMICAGLPDGGRDSCSGDSGGPLVCMLLNKIWYLAGIVSFGNDCALPNFPGVYTRVTKYISWIIANML